MARIIWLASYPKSGNTWLRAFLHNLITGSPEPVDINTLDKFVVSATARGWFDEVASTPTSDLPEVEQLALRAKVHARLTQLTSTNQFAKTHSLFAKVNGYELVTGEATAGGIYLVRNPLDIVSSGAVHYGISIAEMVEVMCDADFSTASSSEHVRDYVGNWSDNVRSWTQSGHTRLHAVRYEDMLERPRKTFRGIVRFLEINLPYENIEKAMKQSSFRVLRRQEEVHGFKERTPTSAHFFRRGKTGLWRNELNAEQIGKLIEAHGEMMTRFGYLRDGAPV